VDKCEALRRTALFRTLDAEALHALAEHAIERRFRKDEVLCVAGAEAHGLYVTVAGAVRAVCESVEGRQQVIHVERAGATVAEVPIFDDGPCPSTVAAKEEMTVLCIAKRDVWRLCVAHPVLALAALTVLAGRSRQCVELVTALSLAQTQQGYWWRILVLTSKVLFQRLTEPHIAISMYYDINSLSIAFASLILSSLHYSEAIPVPLSGMQRERIVSSPAVSPPTISQAVPC
jgi:CRP-like cAMP-binding protein